MWLQTDSQKDRKHLEEAEEEVLAPAAEREAQSVSEMLK